MDTTLRATLVAANAGHHLRYSGDHARPTTCTRCGAPVLAGWDALTMAAFRTVDPTPLTPALEAACWLHLGRYTIELTGHPGGWHFSTLRTSPGIPFVLAGGKPIGPIVPQHICGAPPLAPHMPTRAPRVADLPDNPPF